MDLFTNLEIDSWYRLADNMSMLSWNLPSSASWKTHHGCGVAVSLPRLSTYPCLVCLSRSRVHGYPTSWRARSDHPAGRDPTVIHEV